MDRRTALRKLAAGGAVAVGGSMVLSSNAIADTKSGCPEPPEVPFYFKLSDGFLYVIADPAVALDAKFTGYGWQINGYENLGDPRALQIRTLEGKPIVTGPASNNCSKGSGCPTRLYKGPESVIVSPVNLKTKTREPEPFTEGNYYSIQVWTHWELSGCKLDAYYDIFGQWPKDPIVKRVL